MIADNFAGIQSVLPYNLCCPLAFELRVDFGFWFPVLQGVLLDASLRQDIQPISMLQYDWMHCVLVQGTFEKELELCLKVLGPLGFSSERLDAFLRPGDTRFQLFSANYYVYVVMSSSQFSSFLDWLPCTYCRRSLVWPKHLRALGASGSKCLSKSKTFSASASETLTVSAAIRSYLRSLRLETHSDWKIRITVMSFYALCEVVDVFAASLLSDPDADALDRKVSRHLELFCLAHTEEAVIPKHHFLMHMGDFVRRHPLLLNCFVHERRHKDI